MIKKIALIFLCLFLCIPVITFGDVMIHGFIAQGYLQSSDNNFFADTKDGAFEFNEMGINFSTRLSDRLTAGVQFFARDLGNFGNDTITIDWAYGDFHMNRYFGFRAGKTRCPFGFYNKTRDIDLLRTSIILPQGVYNEGWRDSLASAKGVGTYGIIPLGIMGQIKYNLLAGIMDMEPDGGVGKFAANRADLTVNSIETDTSFFTGFEWETSVEGLRLGFSSSRSDIMVNATTTNGPVWQYRSVQAFISGAGLPVSPDDFIEASGGLEQAYTISAAAGADLVNLDIHFPFKTEWYVYSFEYTWNSLVLASEYAVNKSTYKMTTASTGRTIISRRKMELEGWYGSLSYRLTDLIEFGGYYSVFYPDKNDKNGSTQPSYGYPKAAGWQKDWCFTTRFDLNENWILKLEGHHINGLAVMFMDDQYQNPDGSYDVDKNWFLGAVKISYCF